MESTNDSQSNNEFTPRAYQIDLYERAIQNNTIIYLPTGGGKTYIAVMLLKYLSKDLHIPYNEGGKRSIYIVNTVVLVIQQTEYLRRHSGLTCNGYSGDMHVDFWSKDKWITEIENNQVLVMTSQIFVDLLLHGFMTLDKVNLIIFDECHRAVCNHPMRQIMQRFEDCPKEHQPRVLAMSGTLLNANVKLDKIESTIRTLEITFQAKVATVDSTNSVQGFCTNPKEFIVKYEEYKIPAMVEKINLMTEESSNILKNLTFSIDLIYYESAPEFRPKTKCSKFESIIRDIGLVAKQAGIYGGSKSALIHIIQLECLRKNSDDATVNVVLDYLITQVMCMMKLFENEMKNFTELDQLYKFTSDQIHKLFDTLKKFKEEMSKNQEFCCIIFVKERFTVQVIYHILINLSAYDEQFSFLKPDYILGFQNNPYKQALESSYIAKWNKEVLKRFRTGLSNCIVATDVIDEGVDIPACTLIIRYDLPTDFRAYVQSKGRARHNMSHYVVLMPNNDVSFLKKYEYYKYTETRLKSSLIGQSDLRSLPTEDDITNVLYSYEIEPYIVKRDDTIITSLTATAAVILINSYCSTLMSSKFVQLVPTWKLYKNESSDPPTFKVSLRLPSISPLKTEVVGDYMSSINGAKRSVAMKACKKLHEIGALTNELRPVCPNTILNLTDSSLFPNWIDEKDYSNVPGTYKKRREHKLEYPTVLYGAFPKSSKQLYLHILHCIPTYSVMDYDNRRVVFYELLRNKSGFGILSTTKMPLIPTFPLFMKDGNLNVDIKSNHSTMTLSEKEIEMLRKFHFLLFSEIIPVIKCFMIFDNDNLENSFLIVPLDDNQNINWDVVGTYQHLDRIMPSKPFCFKTSDYDLALVTPTYRGSANVYIVTHVCDDLTPESPFPNEDFDTYTHYYREKHGLRIENLQQAMLEVKPIPVKIDYIKPRKSAGKQAKYKKADDTVEDLQEHLIPELCWKINFPALYWLKATTLPSILHRLSQLLIAEDLRQIITKETYLGTLAGQECLALTLETDVEILKDDDSINESDLTLDDSIERVPLDLLDLNNVYESGDCNPCEDQEPQDLYRNIEHIQMIDIKYYNYFMFTRSKENNNLQRQKSMNNNIGQYIARQVISTPSLTMLSFEGMSHVHGPSAIEIMHALTTKLGIDMFDLERLETLGDSYLKFATSLYLFHKFPYFSEGYLTAIKGKIIGNRNLYYCGAKKNIPGRIKNDAFVPRSNFIAPAYTVPRLLQAQLLEDSVAPNVLYELRIPEEERFSGHTSEDTQNSIQQIVSGWDKGDTQTGFEHYLGVQILSDKTVADSVEALIGVYLRSNGIVGAATLLKWFEILPDINIDILLNTTPLKPVYYTENLALHMPWATALETRFNYKFKDRALLLQAFSHPSYTANKSTDCYQRLEFLGDAVLDFLITCYIYENCGGLTPGELTDLRSALVNNITFACLSVRYGLHTCLLAYAPVLHEAIDRFVKFQEERDYIVNDELLYVLLEEDDCNIAEYVDVPKALGDIFESLVGAIYLDTGKNLTKVWEIVYSVMHKEIEEFSRNVPKQPVRVIHETTDARPKFLEATSVEGTSVIMVPLRIIVAGKEKIFYGFGSNKKQAKCAAAKQALKRLRQEK
ncbi:endoribonuclease Dicer [Pseudomyrmex gracilis]|uniref:endoribonuclease Dicer n=1 Tax=Pseudomyrmex gracilis TaxID=219809 RepID=UPI0009952600|nr:endoribonuclease Dicer [Pseudomyrmex gracilis]